MTGAGTARAAKTDALLARAASHYGAARFAEAAAALEQALAADPDAAALHANLAVVLERLGDPKAERRLRMALALAPALVVGWFNLGNRQLRLGLLGDCARSLRRALAGEPRHVGALTNLGNALRDGEGFDAAARLYRQALVLEPAAAETLYNCGTALHLAGDAERAAVAYRGALARAPRDAWRLRLATLLPPIPGSEAEIDRWRERFRSSVARLAAGPIAIADPLNDCHWTNFYLAYHDRDDRGLQEATSRLWRRAAPGLAGEPARPARPPRAKIRLGFISAFFKSHTIGELFQGVIGAIDRSRFTVVVCQCGPAGDPAAAAIAALADEYLALPADLSVAKSRIAASSLDALLYTDIGMDAMTYYLAHARLAPLQLATWGHPVTTGIDTIDCFVSARGFERDGAEADYSERLVLLNDLLLCWQPRPIGPGSSPRAALGFAETGTVYFCAQSLFKLNPRFDPVLAEILRTDDGAVLHFIEGHRRPWCERIRERLRRFSPDAGERIRFLPRLSADDFVRAMAMADAVLDTPGFSGGKTSLECLAACAPVVTLPSSYLRGRLTYGFYKRIGVEDCIAQDGEDYARIAVGLARDKAWRAGISDRLRERAVSLFGTTAPVRELEAFLEREVSRRGGRPS